MKVERVFVFSAVLLLLVLDQAAAVHIAPPKPIGDAGLTGPTLPHSPAPLEGEAADDPVTMPLPTVVDGEVGDDYDEEATHGSEYIIVEDDSENPSSDSPSESSSPDTDILQSDDSSVSATDRGGDRAESDEVTLDSEVVRSSDRHQEDGDDSHDDDEDDQPCALKCLHGGSPNEACTACDCRNGWTSLFCEVCNLCGAFGTPNEECTSCDCDDHHHGELCDELKDEYESSIIIHGVSYQKSTTDGLNEPVGDENVYIMHLPKLFTLPSGFTISVSGVRNLEEAREFVQNQWKDKYELVDEVKYDFDTLTAVVEEMGGVLGTFYSEEYVEVFWTKEGFGEAKKAGLFDWIVTKDSQAKVDDAFGKVDDLHSTAGGHLTSTSGLKASELQHLTALLELPDGDEIRSKRQDLASREVIIKVTNFHTSMNGDDELKGSDGGLELKADSSSKERVEEKKGSGMGPDPTAPAPPPAADNEDEYKNGGNEEDERTNQETKDRTPIDGGNGADGEAKEPAQMDGTDEDDGDDSGSDWETESYSTERKIEIVDEDGYDVDITGVARAGKRFSSKSSSSTHLSGVDSEILLSINRFRLLEAIGMSIEDHVKESDSALEVIFVRGDLQEKVYFFSTNERDAKKVAELIAELETVTEVERVDDVTKHNHDAKWVLQSHRLDEIPLSDAGLTGNGQVVTVNDWAPDWTHCQLGESKPNQFDIALEDVTIKGRKNKSVRFYVKVGAQRHGTTKQVSNAGKSRGQYHPYPDFVIGSNGFDINAVTSVCLTSRSALTGCATVLGSTQLQKLVLGVGKEVSVKTSHFTIRGKVVLRKVGDPKILRYFAKVPVTSGTSDAHGTHVAGTVAGNCASNPEKKYNGMAPDAKLVLFDMEGTHQAFVDDKERLKASYKSGSRIENNSWGPKLHTHIAKYRTNSKTYDDFAFENRDYLIIFSAGNSGDPNKVTPHGHQTIGEPGVAKNVITVGALKPPLSAWQQFWRFDIEFEGYCFGANTHTASKHCGNFNFGDPFNEDYLAKFSSRGPVEDKSRIKPTVVAPGQLVSAKAQTSSIPNTKDNVRRFTLDSNSSFRKHVVSITSTLEMRYGRIKFGGTYDGYRKFITREADARGTSRLIVRGVTYGASSAKVKVRYSQDGGSTWRDAATLEFTDVETTKTVNLAYSLLEDRRGHIMWEFRQVRKARYKKVRKYRTVKTKNFFGITSSKKVYYVDKVLSTKANYFRKGDAQMKITSIKMVSDDVPQGEAKLRIMSGTSMAAPAITGMATVARQFFTEGFYPSGLPSVRDEVNPSSALLRGVFALSAEPIREARISGQPGYGQGYGRPNLNQVLQVAGSTTGVTIIPHPGDAFIKRGTAQYFMFDVSDIDDGFRAMLSWTDPKSSGASTNKHVVNDLEVTAYVGTVSRGAFTVKRTARANDDFYGAPTPPSMALPTKAAIQANNNLELINIHKSILRRYGSKVLVKVEFKTSQAHHMFSEYSLIARAKDVALENYPYDVLVFKDSYSKQRKCDLDTFSGKVESAHICANSVNNFVLSSYYFLGAYETLRFYAAKDENLDDLVSSSLKTRVYDPKRAEMLAPTKCEKKKSDKTVSCPLAPVKPDDSLKHTETVYEITVWANMPEISTEDTPPTTLIFRTPTASDPEGKSLRSRCEGTITLAEEKHPHGQRYVGWVATSKCFVDADLDEIYVKLAGLSQNSIRINQLRVYDVRRRQAFEGKFVVGSDFLVNSASNKKIGLRPMKRFPDTPVHRELVAEMKAECDKICQKSEGYKKTRDWAAAEEAFLRAKRELNSKTAAVATVKASEPLITWFAKEYKKRLSAARTAEASAQQVVEARDLARSQLIQTYRQECMVGCSRNPAGEEDCDNLGLTRFSKDGCANMGPLRSFYHPVDNSNPWVASDPRVAQSPRLPVV